MRAEISEIEQYKKIYETKSQFLKRAAKMTNAYQLDDEEKRENSNNQNQKGKNEHYNCYQRNKKDIL